MNNADLPSRRPLEILHGEIHTPPISTEVRRLIGFLLGLIQDGEMLSMPVSRPMPSIGPNVHELRVRDGVVSWRVIYQVRPDKILIADVFAKKTQATPKQVIDQCRKRFDQAE